MAIQPRDQYRAPDPLAHASPESYLEALIRHRAKLADLEAAKRYHAPLQGRGKNPPAACDPAMAEHANKVLDQTTKTDAFGGYNR